MTGKEDIAEPEEKDSVFNGNIRNITLDSHTNDILSQKDIDVNRSTGHDYIQTFREEKQRYKKKCIISYLNINSFRYKHMQMSQVLVNH